MSADAYHVRHARARDLPKLQNVEVAATRLFTGLGLIDHLLEEHLAEPDLQEALSGDRLWIAARPDEVPVGFALVTIVDGQPHLEELDVHPDHGRRGLGTRLVEAVCRWASDQGFASVTLSTFRDVPWNAPFYQRRGFRIMEIAEVGQELQARRLDEARRGLPVDERVLMRRML